LLKERFIAEGTDQMIGDVRDEQILLHGNANIAAAVAVGKVGDRPHLRRCDPANGNEETDVVESWTLVVRVRSFLRVNSKMVHVMFFAESGAGFRQTFIAAPFQLRPDPGGAAVFEQERQPGPDARDPRAVIAKDADNLRTQPGGFFRANENVDWRGR